MRSTFAAYVASGTPWTTSLTPIRTRDELRPQAVERGQLVADEVGRGVAVDAEIGDELEAWVQRGPSAATSWSGQRSAAATDVPMVYESPSAT